MALDANVRRDAEALMNRYPVPRSALLPMLHLVQSAEGKVSADGIALCAELLDLTTAEVAAVSTFYTMYKRHNTGKHHIGVCTNTMCGLLGGDAIWNAISSDLGAGHDETTEDGMFTLEKIECQVPIDTIAPVTPARVSVKPICRPSTTNDIYTAAAAMSSDRMATTPSPR